MYTKKKYKGEAMYGRRYQGMVASQGGGRMVASPQGGGRMGNIPSPQISDYGACPPGYGESVVSDKVFTAIPFEFGTVSSGAEETKRYTVSTSVNFVCMQIQALGLKSSDRTTQLNDFSILIRDDYTARDLTKDKVHMKLITGDGQLPYVLPVAYRFYGGTSIAITVQNLASEDQIIYVTLIGYEEPIQAKQQ